MNRPVAWIDGSETLYPPALALRGIRLERLLMIKSRGERAFFAAEQIVQSSCFRVVVISGQDREISPVRTRRLQTMSENADVTTLLILDPKSAAVTTHVALKISVSRREENILVHVEKDRAQRAKNQLLPAPEELAQVAI